MMWRLNEVLCRRFGSMDGVAEYGRVCRHRCAGLRLVTHYGAGAQVSPGSGVESPSSIPLYLPCIGPGIPPQGVQDLATWQIPDADSSVCRP